MVWPSRLGVNVQWHRAHTVHSAFVQEQKMQQSFRRFLDSQQVPELILPRGKVAAPVKPPAAAGKPQGTPAHAQPLPVPALQMPKGKLPKMQRSATAAAAAPAAPPPPLPVPAVAAKPSLAPPKVCHLMHPLLQYRMPKHRIKLAGLCGC